MPHIKQTRRDAIFGMSTTDYDMRILTSGELNFIITDTILEYLNVHELKYATINDIKGALIGVLDEFDARIVRPYEVLKAKENGDVFSSSLEPKIKKLLKIK